MNAATVGILAWIGLITILILLWARWVQGGSGVEEEDVSLSRRRVRREMRVIDGRCRNAGDRHLSSCPIVHSTDDVWGMWTDDPR